MKPAPTTHPDFNAAADHRRWRGTRLKGLWLLLDAELATKPDGVPVWRVLPHGAQVALVRLNGRRTLRIARSERFTTADGPEKWKAECATFVRDFGCTDWEREDDPDAVGVATLFHEPLRLL